MRRGVAQTVARVGDTPPSHCCQGIGYLLARSVLYEALAILAAAYPADVILVNHIQSIQWCAVRARRRVLPIRRSVRTMPWSTPQRGQSCDVRCTKGILLIISNQYHIVFAYRCEGVGCTPPHLSPFADRSVRWRDACGRTGCRGHDHGRLLCESVA